MKTSIILARHEEHTENKLTLVGTHNAVQNGVFLRKHQLTPDVCFSSPEPRCVETALCTMRGAGAMRPIWTDARLGDARMGACALTKDEIADLRIVAQTPGTTPQQELLTDSSYLDFLRIRGAEGSVAISEAIRVHTSKTILVCSHHGSRLEAIFCTLLGCSISKPPFTFADFGSMALVTIPTDGTRSTGRQLTLPSRVVSVDFL